MGRSISLHSQLNVGYYGTAAVYYGYTQFGQVKKRKVGRSHQGWCALKIILLPQAFLELGLQETKRVSLGKCLPWYVSISMAVLRFKLHC